MKHSSSQRGYSLIELVIYLGLFAFLSMILIRSLVTVMRTYAQAQNYRALQNNGELIMERITREIRSGTTVTTSTCPTTSSTLTIASTGGHTNIFALVGSKIQLTSDGTTRDISTTEVTVSSLSFCSYSTPTSRAVKVKVVLTSKTGLAIPWYTTIVVRDQTS